ncbi:MAG: mgtE-like transporter [Actinomycetota bacterium]|jgi:mgtE-like transporter|nr:mgtE-like transporter [Actinomycetota bacterium]
MARLRFRPGARLRALLGPDPQGVRQSLVALVLNSSTSLVAGAFLGSITSTFERLPGLLVLVPAAIGLRGNIFGAFGNRISTTIHSGTFRLSTRRDTVLGQNVLAASILTLAMSCILAAGAKAIAVALGVEHTISLLDLAVVSIVGGALGSVVVLASTLGLAAGAVRYGWDLDNVTAPLVSTLGDVLTLPALFIGTYLVGRHVITPALGVALVIASLASLLVGLRSHLDQLPRIVRESLPVLTIAGAVSAMAGIVLEKRFGSFSHYPALLVLVPAQLSSAGALGGILSGRLSSKLHLGLVEPAPVPSREARSDMALAVVLAAPVFAFNGIGAHLVGRALGHASPGLIQMALASEMGGFAAMLFVLALAYYGTIVAVRVGVDPDTYGIPVVSSSVDFIGAFTLILAIVLLGIG